MRRKLLFSAVIAVLVVALFISFISLDLLAEKPVGPRDVYVGVDVGFGDENEVYRVADAVFGYANLIVIGSLDVTTDTDALTRVCNYLYERDFSFIVYVGFGKNDIYPPQGPKQDFFSTTVKQWSNKFLGAYIFDEPGGKQLDYPLSNYDKPVKNATSGTDAAHQYVHILNSALVNYTGPLYYNAPDLRVYTSDYGLYWFDYLFGYNVVFGEFVGNQSRQLSASLCRGAANVQHMSWGTMITWKYDQAPFLEEPEQLYSDMVLAYENNAEYIVVFNSPENQTRISELGTLTEEHLDAMKRFWEYASTHPRPEENPADTAYVLPRDYGFGFRRPDDIVWGLWAGDAFSAQVWNEANELVSTYGKRLDIVYETLTDDVAIRLPYDKLIFWNGTVIG